MTRLASLRALSGLRTPLLSASVAAVMIVASVVSGARDSSNTTLELMGFDPDRAELISSLLIGGVAAAAATFATGRGGQATLLGLGGFVALFGHTFLRETGDALASPAFEGYFDLSGWLLTLLTLLTVGLISGWIGAVLALSLRPGLIEAGSAVRDAIASRQLDRRRLRLPLAAALVLVLLIITVPVFGDMVNYTPDARMLDGGPPAAGLVPGGQVDSPTPTASSPQPTGTGLGSTPQPTGTGLGSTPQPTGTGLGSTPQPTPSPVDPQPWLAWLPSGGGSVTWPAMRAPWTGGPITNDVAIYTPPGYERGGSRRYPVLYETPFGYGSWDSAINIRGILDALIDKGAIPPMIVVFVNSGDGPYPDTECANSVDGAEWMDTFISQTLVSYVDTHYSTIAQASARAITGFSQGGYCAAILALRHPTVFGTAIPMSGYYWAGAAGSNSRLPFGGNAAALRAASPMVVATELPAAERASLFFIVGAEASQPFYGPQATAFENLLAAQGYSYVVQDANVKHGWVQARHLFPGAVEAWAAHMVAAGVFAS